MAVLDKDFAESHNPLESNKPTLFERLSDFALMATAKPLLLKNYKEFGAQLQCYSYREFLERAEQLLDEALKPDADKQFYRVFVGPDQIGVDYGFSMRAVYTLDGDVISFYLPVVGAMGGNPKTQLEEFGKSVRREAYV